MRASPGSIGHAASGVVIAVVTLCLAVPALAGWGGSEKTTDGVVHVMSPADPIEEPVTRAPERLWVLEGDNEEYFFGVISQICADADGNLYALDSQLNEVMIFTRDGEYVGSIGREGEGPGEFRRPSDLFVTADGHIAVLQRMPGKIVLLTPDGEPAGDYPLPQPEGGGMQMLHGGRGAGQAVVLNLMRFARREAGMDTKAMLVRVDDSGALTATYHSLEESRDFAKLEFDERKMGGALVWNVGPDGRVYTSADFDAYTIEVWAPDGTVEHVIEREYKARVRNEEEKKRNSPKIMIRSGNQRVTPNVIVSDTDRDVVDLYPRDDGSLWVLSSHGAFDAGDEIIATFDVFDRDGKFAEQVTFQGRGDYADDGFHIVGDRLYVVAGFRSAEEAMTGGSDEEEDTDIEAEPISIICYHIGPIVQTKN